MTTKKQLLKTIGEFHGRMFYTHELATVEDQPYQLVARHLRELARAGKLHLIHEPSKKESCVWSASAEPVAFVADARFVRFGAREK